MILYTPTTHCNSPKHHVLLPQCLHRSALPLSNPNFALARSDAWWKDTPNKNRTNKSARPPQQKEVFFVKKYAAVTNKRHFDKMYQVFRARKGAMSAEAASLPYSRKSLESLANTLKLHSAFIWVDPATNSISLKHVTRGSQRTQEWVQG